MSKLILSLAVASAVLSMALVYSVARADEQIVYTSFVANERPDGTRDFDVAEYHSYDMMEATERRAFYNEQCVLMALDCADIDGDGVVGGTDISLVTGQFGDTCP